ncbi:hypothetical protein OK016_28185 [Vibrio chagasii]|nr:hypothetical protein [Vibrio chagasii]
MKSHTPDDGHSGCDPQITTTVEQPASALLVTNPMKLYWPESVLNMTYLNNKPIPGTTMFDGAMARKGYGRQDVSFT